MEIYLDNSATTKVMEPVRDAMLEMLGEDYGNPSSLHRKGSQAEEKLKQAKKRIADTLKVDSKEIFFTSGGTEANNLALIGGAMAAKRRGMHLITTCIEHPSVAQTMDYLETQGFEVTRMPVDAYGRVSVEQVINSIRPDTTLISVMMVNNEIGAREPIEELGAAIKAKNPDILFHVDAIQAYGKYQIRPKKWGIDLLSASGHKIHGPKGIGFLYIRDKVKLQPIIWGGQQQKGIRSGTENMPGIVGIGQAAYEIYKNFDEEIDRLYELRQAFAEGAAKLPGTQVNGLPGRESAPHVVSVSFEGVRSEVLLHALEDKGIYVSAGSACSSHKKEVSPTLKAIGLPKEYLDSTLRFSFSIFNTQEEVQETLQALEELLPMLRRFYRK